MALEAELAEAAGIGAASLDSADTASVGLQPPES
jgi:hypothetical protein